MAASLLNTTSEDQNLETYCLIWLDPSVNQSEKNIQAQKRLRTSINHLLTFENDHKCLNYIKSVSKDDRIVLIVSGRLGQIIVPKIVKYRQIASVYIYCMDIKANEQWAQNYSKVKGVFNHLNELINKIKTDKIQRQQYQIDESLSINIFNSNLKDQEQSTNGLNGQFIHSQLLIDCLIRMKSNFNDKNELINFCKQQYKDNNFELEILKEFEKDYVPERSLWWYTRESFLCRLLNKALRIQNIDLLYLFRFFIRHIGQELEINKCESFVRVYRAQIMSKEEIEILKNSIGELISMNSFLSTSLNQKRARDFFSMNDLSNDLKRVFFEIDADPKLENIKSFSNIASLSYYPDEEEILFMVGSIFRLVNIKRDQDGIEIIQMTLCSYNDHNLQTLFEHMKKKMGVGETNLLNFGRVLNDMGKLDHAEKYYLRFLNELSDDHEDIGTCFSQLGRVAHDKRDYKSSLEWYNKSLKIKLRTLNSDHPSIASNYNNIALVHQNKDDYEHALESYNKALIIYERKFGDNHFNIAACLNNMGIVYKKQKKYSEALEVWQKSLAIIEKCLPSNHSRLGDSHINIGNIYDSLGDKDRALKHYHLSLKIYTKSLPPEHPHVGFTLENIGVAHEHKNELQQALSYYEKAAKIYRHSFASTHSDVLKIEKSIQRVSSKLK